MARKSILLMERAVAMRRAGSSNEEARAFLHSQGMTGGIKVSGAAKVALGVAGAALLPAVLPAALIPTATRMLNPNNKSLTPGTTPGAFTNDVNWSSGPGGGNSGWGAATTMGCNLIPNAAARAACLAFVGHGGSGNNGGGGGLVAQDVCPTGYHWNGQRCQIDGVGGWIPGDVGNQDFGWDAVNGRYGAGYVPIVMQRQYSRCPPGSKLGKDGLCYDRIARTNRMHNPGAKPLFTGGDMNTLRRARAITRRGRKALAKHMPAAKRCAPKKGRKR